MRARRPFLAFVLLLTLHGRAASEPAPDLVPILWPVDWNGIDCEDECIADLRRQSWLALVPGKGGWSLVETRLSFAQAASTGIRSSVADAAFYLSHPALKAGHSSTPNLRFKDNPRDIRPDAGPLKFDFHGRSYEIVLAGHDVVLRSGGRQSFLGRVSQDEDESTLSVMWAGDLDGDGELDLIVQRNNTKNGQLCLMLSSANKQPGEIAADVGCQFFSG